MEIRDGRIGRDWRLLLSVALCLLLVVPFLPTAFRIDEPNIIAIAEQMAKDPLDPYGFIINWNGLPEPAFEILANPPLLPGWLRVWAAGFGWSELALHAAMIPFVAISLLAFGMIARKWGYQAHIAVYLLIGSPAFFIASQVVMPDIAMLAAFLLSVLAGFPRVNEEARDVTDSRWFIGVALGAAFIAPLLKYNAILLVPLHLVMALLFTERRSLNLMLATMPMIGLAVWSVVSALIYGDIHVLAISRFQAEGRTLITSGLIGALGFGVIPLAAVCSMIRGARKEDLAGAALAALVCGSVARWVSDYTVDATLLFAASGGIVTLLMLMVGRSTAVDRGSRVWRMNLLLFAWIVLVFLFQYRLFFVAARYLLPMIPPILILALGSLEHWRRRWILLLLSVAVSLSFAVGDARIANTYRTFFERLQLEGLRPQTADGHWGFQYYAEKMGAEVIDPRQPLVLNESDVHVNARAPFSTLKTPEPAEGVVLSRREWYAHPRWAIRTIDCESAANFHGNVMKNCRHYLTSFLPVGFSFDFSDRFEIYEAKRVDERSR
jgi:4-amino-4-deoxy-L-arabinose transferase-like glycosyltransferase